MLSLNQVRVGSKIIFRNAPFEVTEANHLKMGRGGAKLVTKMRNLLTQAVIDYTFAGDEKIEEADIYYRAAQFLYKESGEAFFMTNDDFEQLSLHLAENKVKFLKEGESVDLMIWQGRLIDVKLPPKVDLQVTYTEPGFKGNTTSAAMKPATLETGAQINVPLFINAGDIVRINTETSLYDSRITK